MDDEELEGKSEGLTAVERDASIHRVLVVTLIVGGVIAAASSGYWSDRPNLWFWIAVVTLLAVIVGAHSIGILSREYRRVRAGVVPQLRWRIRLAIVATIFLLAIGTVWAVAWQRSEHYRFAELAVDSCEAMNRLRVEQSIRDSQPLPQREECWSRYDQTLARYGETHVWRDTFAVMLALSSVLWLLGLVIYLAVVWVLAGRMPKEPEQ